MGEARGEVNLLQEPFGTERRGQLGAEDLQGDIAIMAEIVSEEYDSHATPPDFPYDPIPVAQRRFETTAKIGQVPTLQWPLPRYRLLSPAASGSLDQREQSVPSSRHSASQPLGFGHFAHYLGRPECRISRSHADSCCCSPARPIGRSPRRWHNTWGSRCARSPFAVLPTARSS